MVQQDFQDRLESLATTIVHTYINIVLQRDFSHYDVLDRVMMVINFLY